MLWSAARNALPVVSSHMLFAACPTRLSCPPPAPAQACAAPVPAKASGEDANLEHMPQGLASPWSELAGQSMQRRPMQDLTNQAVLIEGSALKALLQFNFRTGRELSQEDYRAFASQSSQSPY